MKTYKFFSIVLLVTLLASCAPVTSVPSATPVSINQKNDWSRFNYDPTNQKPILDIVYDPKGSLWASSVEGVLHWDVDTGELIKYALPTKNRNIYVSAMTHYDGALYVALDDGCVGTFMDGKWNYQKVSSEMLFDFSFDGQMLWLNGAEGLFYLEGVNWKLFQLPLQAEEGLLAQKVVKSNNGILWIQATKAYKTDDVYSWQGDEWLLHRELNGVVDIINDSNGVTWFVFYDRLLSYDGVNWDSIDASSKNSQILHSIGFSGLTPSGYLWVQTLDDKVFILKNGVLVGVKFPPFPIDDGFTKVIYLWDDGIVVQINNEIYMYNK